MFELALACALIPDFKIQIEHLIEHTSFQGLGKVTVSLGLVEPQAFNFCLLDVSATVHSLPVITAPAESLMPWRAANTVPACQRALSELLIPETRDKQRAAGDSKGSVPVSAATFQALLASSFPG